MRSPLRLGLTVVAMVLTFPVFALALFWRRDWFARCAYSRAPLAAATHLIVSVRNAQLISNNNNCFSFGRLDLYGFESRKSLLVGPLRRPQCRARPPGQHRTPQEGYVRCCIQCVCCCFGWRRATQTPNLRTQLSRMRSPILR